MPVIDDYLQRIDPPQRIALERVRKVIHDTIPNAVEVISYGMPAFRHKNAYVIGFAAFTHHMSIFPTSHPIEVLQDKLADFRTSKGTVQFTLNNELPAGLIKELIRIRLHDIDTAVKH